ncbi:undecaprenyldiphospho-muramoylpentapeptide beta-N-acetylglucosaminyltransferase [Roseiterribacter gracilis]|uniref:UDP-N-acetylglucosamine--N-acetylmuramyl-(pentapeptide) pyrophosphoryl-undecaprenol N-acetylglucosamine transferase n=1 Tax=Roseiterribacter gracilis TaxID=2812848 RepID=A0A8S8XCI0_9PROT|nr:UDP-N-acetylglucosamine--N-acetylmuramyl-(pentapeptide) pyrophosphoryl-undecaprenol N-acetylglucosamine transferase [Rhodospirillales bacterium TMPK1]
MTQGLVLLAAGGTGGHIFPAEALARELVARGRAVALVTDKRGGAFGDDLGVPVHRIRASSMQRGLRGKARTGLELAIGAWQARALLNQLKPAMIVGFGGYPSLPTLFAARRAGLPYVLHEQNAVLGRANRLFAKHATRIATSFENVTMLPEGADARITLTGNPTRPAIAGVAMVGYPKLTSDGRLNILVVGGSQGAHIFSEIVPAALAHMPENLRKRISIAQQCRADDLPEAKSGFARSGVTAELATFFQDMPSRLAAAHIVIARAGASTCAELTVAGRPAILVPYPFAMDDHQAANAEQIAASGAAWSIPQRALTPMALATRLENLMTAPSGLEKAADAARALGRADAAQRLADLVEQVASRATRPVETQSVEALPVEGLERRTALAAE